MLYQLLTVSSDSSGCDIDVAFFENKRKAFDAMVKEIAENTDYKTVEALVEASDSGEIGHFDDDGASISTGKKGMLTWMIIRIPIPEES